MSHNRRLTDEELQGIWEHWKDTDSVTDSNDRDRDINMEETEDNEAVQNEDILGGRGANRVVSNWTV